MALRGRACCGVGVYVPVRGAYYNENDKYAAAWLRAYGNAIVAEAAAEFIRAYVEIK